MPKIHSDHGLISVGGRAFRGYGPTVGVGIELGKHWIIDASGMAVTTSVKGHKGDDFADHTWYLVSGFQAPVTITFLERDRATRFNWGVGLGFQYVYAHGKRYRTELQQTELEKEVKINDIVPTARLLFQFRIVQDLELTGNTYVGFMRRLTATHSLGLRYTLRKKQSDSASN